MRKEKNIIEAEEDVGRAVTEGREDLTGPTLRTEAIFAERGYCATIKGGEPNGDNYKVFGANPGRYVCTGDKK